LAVKANAQSACHQPTLDKSAWLQSDRKYQKAISILEGSLAKYPNCAATYIRLSDLYYRVENTMLAISCCNKAISLNPSEGANATMFLHKQMLFFKQDSMAAELLRLTANNAALNDAQKRFLGDQFQTVSSKITLVAAKSNAQIINLGDSINNDKQQTFPSISADGKLLIYTSIQNDLNEDLFFSKYDSCTNWSMVQNLGYPPNTGDPEAAPCLSADRRYLFFTRCNTVSERGYDGGGCDIIFSYWQNDSGWSSPQIFGATVNTAAYEGQACISSNGLQLYFVSNRPGGFGGKDIYVTNYIEGLWREPHNLGPMVNTSGDEGAPFIHADGMHLYFSSNGHKGMGKADLFLSTVVNDSTFTKPLNLGAPINSEFDENSINIDAGGKMAYIASTRNGGFGKFDIYQCALPQHLQSAAQVVLFGRVIDKYEKTLLRNYTIKLYDTFGKFLDAALSNSGDASYKFIIPANAIVDIEVATEDSGFQVYKKRIFAKKAIDNTLKKHLKLKRFEEIDTILNLSYVDSNFADTNLRFVGQELQKQQFEIDDSVVIELNATENSFIDTTMLNTFCFSDPGRLDYLRYIQQLQDSKQKENSIFLDFYKRYLQQQKKGKLKIVDNVQHIVNDSKQLFNISILVLEYY
jgi:hypothetical protein